MKKIISVFIMLILLFTSIKVMAMADSADCACVINAVTGETVFAKNMNERHSMASTTKIMTAVIALEKCKMDEIVVVSAEAANQEGSAAYISEGDQICMKDMLYGLMLNSGNDAAFAIAEHISGNTKDFAKLMNQKAELLGLKDTHFVNPSGLDDSEHYTTAWDLAMLARYAMNNSDFREIVAAQTYQIKPVNSEDVLYCSNHNKMLHLYEGSTGIKTGYTKKTGRCLVSSAQRNDMEFIAVTLGAPNDWNEHSQMLDYAFSEYYPKRVIEKNSRLKIAEINGEKYSFVAAENFTVPLKENEGCSVEVVSHVAEGLKAPINKGEKVGYAEIKYNGNRIGDVDIIAKEDIIGNDGINIKNSFFDMVARFFKEALCF